MELMLRICGCGVSNANMIIIHYNLVNYYLLDMLFEAVVCHLTKLLSDDCDVISLFIKLLLKLIGLFMS